jgi:prephenate dehydrogenase
MSNKKDIFKSFLSNRADKIESEGPLYEKQEDQQEATTVESEITVAAPVVQAEPVAKAAVNSLKKGLKEKEVRHTFVLKEDLLKNFKKVLFVKNIGKHPMQAVTMKEVAAEMMDQYVNQYIDAINRWESENGEIDF